MLAKRTEQVEKHKIKVKDQARKQFDKADLLRLAESMLIEQLQPIGLTPDYTLCWGERRWRAAMLHDQITHLWAVILDKPMIESDFRVLQLTENLLREDLTGPEQWAGVVELLRLNPGWTQKQLAEQLHIDPSMVIRLLSPSKCVESVQAAFAEGKIGISDCYALSRLAEAEQAAALAMRLNGASRDELASHARRQKSGGKPDVRASRIKCELAGGMSVVVAGDSLGLDEVIDALSAAQKSARAARDQNLDVKTWSAVMRDRARNGG